MPRKGRTGREAAQLLEQTGDRWEVNTANWHVAYCQYRLGALAEAVAAARDTYRAGVADKGLRQEYVAPVLPWLATARRHEVMAAQDLTPQRRTRLLREARRAARRARWLARWYRNNLPHALRETGLIAAMTGRPSTARKYLDRSLAVAARQSAGWEHAQTLLARGRIGLETGWAGAEDDVAAASAAMRELGIDVPTLDAHTQGTPPSRGTRGGAGHPVARRPLRHGAGSRATHRRGAHPRRRLRGRARCRADSPPR